MSSKSLSDKEINELLGNLDKLKVDSEEELIIDEETRDQNKGKSSLNRNTIVSASRYGIRYRPSTTTGSTTSTKSFGKREKKSLFILPKDERHQI